MAGYMENQTGKNRKRRIPSRWRSIPVQIAAARSSAHPIPRQRSAPTAERRWCWSRKKAATDPAGTDCAIFQRSGRAGKICARKMKKAIFAPKALRDPSSITSFRGIYMPFWLYKTARNDKLSAKGTRQYSKGDYDYTDYYDISATADAVYDGIAFDSASSFEDAISAAIAPLSGRGYKTIYAVIYQRFYADVSTSRKVSIRKRRLRRQKTTLWMSSGKWTADWSDVFGKKAENFSPGRISRLSALLPVWFMAYRKKTGGYAVINGDTGKMASTCRWIRRGIFIFPDHGCTDFLLIYFFIRHWQDAVTVTGILAMIAVLVNTWEMRKIARKDSRTGRSWFQGSRRDGREEQGGEKNRDGR